MNRLGQQRYARLIYSLVMLLCGLFGEISASQAATIVQQETGGQAQILNKSLEIWKDPTAAQSIDQVASPKIANLFVPATQHDLKAAYTHSAIWLRLVLKNVSVQEELRYLELAAPRVEDIQLFQKNNEGLWQSSQLGTKVPVSQREIKSRYSVFPVALKPSEEKQLYIRIQSRNSIMINARLWGVNDFNSHDNKVNIINGMQFGILAIFALYALMLFVGSKDLLYLYFSIVVLSCLANDIAFMQYGFAYLWPDYLEWNVRSPGITGSPLLLAGAMLVMHSLKLAKNMPGTIVILRVALCLVAGNMLAMMWLDYRFWVIIQQVLGAALLAYLAALTLYAVYHKQEDSLLLLTSFLVVWLVGLARLGQVVGLLGSDFAADYSQNWAMILSGILIIGLLNRKLKAHEKERALFEQKLYEERVRAEIAAQRRVIENTQHMQLDIEIAKAESRAKTDFIAQLSHELRTPLHSVLGYSNLILADHPVPTLHRRVMAIQQSGQHLLNLINRLLDFARIEAGRIHLDPQATRLHRFLTLLADEYRLLAQNQGVALRLNLHDSVYATVMVDEARLRQVLSNLIVNAYQHSHGTIIELAARAEREGDRLRLWLAIQDNGRGISQDVQERLFQPFVSGDSRAASNRYNMGLGLSIARDLVRLMGGELGYAQSTAAGGQFYFQLDLPWLADEARSEGGTGEQIPTYVGPKRTILLLEKSQDARAVLADILVTLGFDIAVASSGKEASRLLAQQPIDLVMAPAELPDMSCCSLMDEAKHQGKDLPFIQLSKVSKEKPVDCALAGKFAHLLQEPISSLKVAQLLIDIWPERWESPLGLPLEGGMVRPSDGYLEKLMIAVDAGMISDIYDWIDEVTDQEPDAAGFAEAVQIALLSMDLESIKRMIGYK